MTQVMSLEEIEDLIIERLPRVLERDPQFATWLEGLLAQRFPRRDEFARLLDELQEHRVETAQQFARVDRRLEKLDEDIRQHRAETSQQFAQVNERFGQVDNRFEQVDRRFEQIDSRFEQVDSRFEQLEQKLDDGFRQMQITIDRLGARWGIRNESIFRQTMKAVLESSFGAQVQERYIGGEQFDCVIIGGTHILIEISASVGRDIVRKLQRKRQLYTDETGITPARFILAVGSIHSQRAAALRAVGFEVIEPEDEDG